MSIEAKSRVEADPFRYGYRVVARKRPDGRVETAEVPLSLEDLLFPREGDQELHNQEHIELCLDLYAVFRERLRHDPGALVLTDHRVDYNVPGIPPVGPDVAIFRDAAVSPGTATVDLGEGGRPVLVIEVTSPETRKNDFGIKKEIYHRAGVPVYAIVDLRPTRKRPRSLHGFRHTPEGYEPIPPDDQGRLWLEPVNLWLAIADDRVICLDGETGAKIGDYLEQVQGRREAEARAEAERARAEAERARAEAERARADTFEARLAAMEEEIRKLKGG
ncbi:Uma2 family endonuclease [Tundrisphaera sp. TA3]|uniref:Uma2 family endonuclease n=1 Tax=Tundrisphaera sp. TA3 TaxID=3435775 RepID=UPI003EBF5153